MIIQKLFPLFDRAHGSNVAGKASPAHIVPAKFNDDDQLVFREFEFSEDMIDRIEQKWTAMGYESERTIPDNCPLEPGLLIRQQRINAFKPKGQIITLSIHSNAITMGDKWQNTATGFAYFTAKGITNSDKMNTRLYKFSEQYFPEIYHYKSNSPEYPGKEANFTVLTAKGNAILLEIGFQDNRKDVAMLLDPKFREKYSTMIVEWLVAENRLLIQVQNSQNSAK